MTYDVLRDFQWTSYQASKAFCGGGVSEKVWTVERSTLEPLLRDPLGDDALNCEICYYWIRLCTEKS